DVRPVHVLAREAKIGLDGRARVVRAADDEAADDPEAVPVEMCDRLDRRIAGRLAALAASVLCGGLQKRQILVEDVLDAEEDVAESCLAHQGRERRAVLRERR